MAKVGAQRAAELTGKSKSTIQRAMTSGKLSFELDGNGRRIIDVSEIDRVFGLKKKESPQASAAVEHELEKAKSLLEMERLKMRITILEEQVLASEKQIDELKSQRDSWQSQANQVLLTSQYSQKQAEKLETELAERKRRAEERKQQYMAKQQAERERQSRVLRAHNENRPIGQDALDAGARIWKKITGAVA